MNKVPMADAGSDEEKEKIRTVTQRRGLGGVANNAKWNELISFFREKEDWRPSYRYKWVDGHISGWDVEWWYHLPFPFVGVEWFDIGLHQAVHVGRLIDDKKIDHSGWILPKLKEIGFEYEVIKDCVRIWGYMPKSYDEFPPESA